MAPTTAVRQLRPFVGDPGDGPDRKRGRRGGPVIQLDRQPRREIDTEVIVGYEHDATRRNYRGQGFAN